MAVPGRAITVEELLALNDELRSLARAGVPLESGLRALGQDLPGRLGRLAETISDRLERGESLVAVLGDPQLKLPPLFCAVVAAGVRGGRLPAALESLSLSVRRAVELRKTMLVGAVYPLLVLIIATIVFAFTWLRLFPLLRQTIPALIEQEMPAWFHWLTWSVDQGWLVLIAFWLLILLAGGAWWVQTRGAAYYGVSRWRWTIFNPVSAAGRSATFAETMALLIEHNVPMIESLQLSGEASGDRYVRQAASMLAERIRAGTLGGAAPPGLPPLLCWLMLTSAPSSQVIRALRQMATTLRDRAQQESIVLGIYLPIFLSAGVGAIVGLYYAILVMMPFYYLLYQLTLS